jgi:hypothetical protein
MLDKGLMVGKKIGLDPTQQDEGNLKHFSIAGADKKWHWADAKIVGDKVVLSSKNVKTPVACPLCLHHEPSGCKSLQYRRSTRRSFPYR